MSQIVNSTTPFSGTVDTIPPLLIAGTITVAASNASVLTLEVALEDDVNSSLVQLFPAFTYMSGAYVQSGTLQYDKISEIPLATKSMKDGTEIVLEGTLKFALKVISPAMKPPQGAAPPEPDTNTSYEASVTLSPTHNKWTSA